MKSVPCGAAGTAAGSTGAAGATAGFCSAMGVTGAAGALGAGAGAAAEPVVVADVPPPHAATATTNNPNLVIFTGNARGLGLIQPMSATDPSYILSRRFAYFFSTTLRFTFRLGVSSPSSTDRSFGRISNFFTVSYFA